MKYILSIIVLFLSLPSTCSAQDVKPEKPNILFILMDDMGIGDVGVYFQNLRKEKNDRSEPWLETPNLDKLASSGVILNSHYVGAPVCAPSRASLLSGLNQGHTNIRNNQFDKAIANDFTLGSVMQKAGYETAIIGKWGISGKGTVYPDWPAHPSKRGFDYFLGYIFHGEGHEHYPKEGVYKKKKDLWENYNNIVESLDKCYTGDLFTAAAKKWIIEQNSENIEKPFFLYLAYDTPHAVWELPTMEYPKGGGLDGGMQWLDEPGHMISTASGKVDSWIDPLYKNQTWNHDKDSSTKEVSWPNSYKRYATSISRIDEHVGDLVKLLGDLKIADNTILVFTSDNGPSKESYLNKKKYGPNDPDFFNSFGPFDGIKRDVWQGGVVVPTIVVWPREIPANWQLDSPSSFSDWLATFADASGNPVPVFTNGTSMLPLLKKEKTKDDRTVYIEYSVGKKTPNYPEFDKSHRNRKRGQMQLLRKGDTVAIRYDIKKPSDNFEVYDVSKDPQQKYNLAKKYDFKAKQKGWKQTVLKMRKIDTSSARPYDKSSIIPTIKKNKVKSNTSWKFYSGKFPWLTDDADLEETNSGTTKKMEALKIDENEEGIISFEGYLDAPSNGVYTFSLPASTQLIMKIYQSNVINNDFRANKKGIVKGKIKLKKGLHPFKIYYYKNKDMPYKGLGITWAGPGISKSENFEGYIK
tara:strand:+ start:15519 stop:17600 length:2082 start_codon:yes stop_codon:yes gene_type:complete